MKKKLIFCAALLMSMIFSFGFASCTNESGNSNSQINSSEDSDNTVIPEFSISATEMEIGLNKSAALTVENAIGAVTWASSDTNIATVENGVVRGIAFGTVDITATADNGEVVCKVKVVPVYEDRTRFELSETNARIYKGDTYDLGASIITGTQSTPAQNVVWSTDNAEIATVENGVVTAMGTGSATITASVVIDGKTYTDSCVIDVILLTELTVNNQTLVFTKTMEKPQLDITCTIFDGEEKTVPVTDLDFTVAENSGIVMKEDGSFEILKGGKTEVTISYKNYYSQTYTLDVYDALITTPEEFFTINDAPDGLYMLLCDVDFKGVTFNEMPAFSGTLNGNGYSLKNIIINSPDGGGRAIFCELSGTVCNLGIENVRVASFFGGMVGQGAILARVFSGVLENVYISGNVEGVVATTTPWCDYTTWGMATGTIVSKAVGGIVKNSIFDITVDEDTDVQLFCGTGVLYVDNVYVYSNGGQLPTVYGAYSIQNGGACVIGEKSTTLAASISALDDGIWTVTESGVSLNEGCAYYVPKAVYTITLYNGTSVLKTWEVEEYGRLEKPSHIFGETIVMDFNFDFMQPITSNVDIYATCYTGAVSTAEEFMAMKEDGKYILKNDIDFAQTVIEDGTYIVSKFNGLLEGNGYALKNIILTASQPDKWTAIFGSLGGTIRHMAIENIRLEAWGGEMIGESALIAQTLTGSIENIRITGSIAGVIKTNMVFADYTSWDFQTGMLVAYANGGTIRNIVVNVSCDSANNGIYLLVGKGSYNYGNIFVVTDNNTNLSTHFGANCTLKDNAWSGMTTLTEMAPTMDEVLGNPFYASTNDGVWEWNTTDGNVIPELIQGCKVVF